MMHKFKVSIPHDYLNALPGELATDAGPDGLKRGVELFLKLSERLERLGAPGIHLFVISDTSIAVLGLKELAGI